MKLINLLSKYLPNIGGWPKGIVYIAQKNDGVIYGNNDLKLRTLPDFVFRGLPLSEDYETAKITKKQYESALAAKQELQWNGEALPPVGAVCQWDNGENDWCNVEIMGVNGEELWVKPLDGSQSFVVCDSDFRPLADERELAIESMMKVFKSMTNGKGIDDVFKALYDAGWRKHDDI